MTDDLIKDVDIDKIQQIKNGYPWIPKDKRKKILLLSDDMRLPSGVGTMSKEFVIGTCHHYNWVQVGGAIGHPDKGKRIEISADIEKHFGVKDPSIIIYPQDGYGDENLIRYLMMTEKPNAILHYTDPRFWVWLYQMEHEIRMEIPIFYYCIWDDLPDPMWNASYYASSDLLMTISKQSYGIHKRVLDKGGFDTVEISNVDDSYVPTSDMPHYVSYVPHGINENILYPIGTDGKAINKVHDLFKVDVDKDGKETRTEVKRTDMEMLSDFKKDFFKGNTPDFSIIFVARNIRRKLPGDVVLAYKEFCDGLPKEEADKCCLVMHTQPIDDNGTDLIAVTKNLCPYRVEFSAGRLEPMFMNYLFNCCDVVLNMASNEGFGLGTAEGMMAGLPIVGNVTGGIQDQFGFMLEGELLTAQDYLDIETLHDRDIWKDNPILTWGDWAFPVWPSNRSLQGSPPTPYIFDDRPDYKEVAKSIRQVYDRSEEDRYNIGLMAREHMLKPEVGQASSEMSRRFIHDMEFVFDKWKPRSKFSIFKA